MRIISMIMREQMTTGFARAQAQMSGQMQTIGEQRAQVGEEMYPQMKQAMEASAELLRNSASTAAKFPQPTPAEQALQEKYRQQISETMREEQDEWENRDF